MENLPGPKSEVRVSLFGANLGAVSISLQVSNFLFANVICMIHSCIFTGCSYQANIA